MRSGNVVAGNADGPGSTQVPCPEQAEGSGRFRAARKPFEIGLEGRWRASPIDGEGPAPAPQVQVGHSRSEEPKVRAAPDDVAHRQVNTRETPVRGQPERLRRRDVKAECSRTEIGKHAASLRKSQTAGTVPLYVVLSKMTVPFRSRLR